MNPIVSILPFSLEHKDALRALNYEWLEKYFYVEPNDIIQLADPVRYILDKGGLIFYAHLNGEVIGTASLMKISADEYELAKMAVTERHKGIGAGRMLMEHCITAAKELGARKLSLFSNTKLVAAINLYRKYGFEEAPFPADVHYARSDIKMEKTLT